MEILKSCLAKEPISKLPDFAKEFIVQVDASDLASCCALMQDYDGTLFPVAHASKMLLQSESKYYVIEREGLALEYAVKKW